LQAPPHRRRTQSIDACIRPAIPDDGTDPADPPASTDIAPAVDLPHAPQNRTMPHDLDIAAACSNTCAVGVGTTGPPTWRAMPAIWPVGARRLS
jgi:hypothetical protein